MIKHCFTLDRDTFLAVAAIFLVMGLATYDGNTSSADSTATVRGAGDVIAPLPSIPEGEEPETVTASTRTVSKPAASVLTYEEAIAQFGGYRFQFINCSGTPGSMTLKKGSTFLLDNRDDKTRTIKVGSKTYTLAPYGFAVATASEVGTLAITCNGGGAAQLTVQP